MRPRHHREAFLVLCDGTSWSVLQSFRKIQTASNDPDSVYLLYHQKTKKLPAAIREFKHFAFTDEVITHRKYYPIGFNLVPGNNHFPLLEFYLNHPHYDYYWCIEQDVTFNGEWSLFFHATSVLDKDFMTSHIRMSHEEPQWHWWATLAHPYEVIPFKERIRCFNPIYRLSNLALSYIYEALMNHWCGHHEVLLPTLLSRGGFKIMDFGGKGKFVLKGWTNRFYVSSTPNSQGELMDGTMRWRPVFRKVGRSINKLYHPVKHLCDDDNMLGN